MKTEKIIGTTEAWENGTLGRDPAFATPAPTSTAHLVDDALGMQLISIRLPKNLIEEFKLIAQVHKVGYQPLMRDALQRFADAEMKKMARQYANERLATERARQTSEPRPDTVENAQGTAVATSASSVAPPSR